MYFTNLLSQDPQLEPTYGRQCGTSPVTLDDSPPQPSNEPIGVRKSVRGANFTPEEDKLLVSAWLNCSLDAVQGTDQKHSQLWEKKFEYFQQFKETTNERTIKSLIHRWSFDKVKVMYQSLEKCSFQFEHYWHLLKDQPKWIWRATKEDPKRRKMMSPSPTLTRCSGATVDSVFDLEVDHVMENEVIEPDRPIGRKVEKGKRKTQDQHAEENFQLRKMKYTLLEESRAQEKEFFRLKAEKMAYDKETEARKLLQEDERLQLEAEKVELAKKESDQRIMMMDVSVMPELQREFFQQLQREVMARRNRSDDLD
ncbi:hypothetical protein CIPAW_04G080400 [Carya illinoinensis]|uniref:No apical meristem-associated C-terminal domain-containing protein n=1 Tax=Carya illinoinensis TaxID=32201 RepID=A0A8T1QRW6_CARIL|nr:hypothetical protein CIPAW_04G080400 [Carya illinoinensis]